MIATQRRGPVEVLTIDRQERRNAVDAVACRDLQRGLTDAVDGGARVVVLTGAGGHFCAGADLGARMAWADDIAALAPLTIAGNKLALNRLEAGLGHDEDVTAAFRQAWSSSDLAEGMTAFRERRPPNFTGR